MPLLGYYCINRPSMKLQALKNAHLNKTMAPAPICDGSQTTPSFLNLLLMGGGGGVLAVSPAPL